MGSEVELRESAKRAVEVSCLEPDLGGEGVKGPVRFQRSKGGSCGRISGARSNENDILVPVA